jgi:hypothetical protein
MPYTRKNNMRKSRKNNMRKSRKNNTMSGGTSGGKRKLSGYMKFANKHRAEIMRSNPRATVPDIGRALGKKWRGLSEAEKKSYS